MKAKFLCLTLLIGLFSIQLLHPSQLPIRKNVSGRVTDAMGGVWTYRGWVEYEVPSFQISHYDVWVTSPTGASITLKLLQKILD